MTESAGGVGTANDATIVAEDGVPLTSDEREQERLAKGREEGRANRLADAQKAVEAAEASLAKTQAHVEGAQQAVEQAQADLAAVEAEEV